MFRWRESDTLFTEFIVSTYGKSVAIVEPIIDWEILWWVTLTFNYDDEKDRPSKDHSNGVSRC